MLSTFTRTTFSPIRRHFHQATLRGFATATTKDAPHTTDTYAKDVDTTPALDSQVHRLDPESENVQKPYEAPSGEWSRAGVKTSEYASVNKSEQPYAPKEPEGQRSRYGGKSNWPADKGASTSHPGEGPAGSDAGGRKPEGR